MNHRKIKRHHISSFILLLICFQNLKAQERQVLNGEISADSIQNISGVHVINLSAEIGTTTNADGKFKIMAKAGDSIFFSSVQFEHKTEIISKSDLKNGIKVALREKFNELDEVQLDDIRLSGVLSEDIARMPKSIYEKLGMSFPKPRPSSLEIAQQSAAGDPVSAILNTLNGKIAQLKKAEENNNLTIIVNKGLNLVGKAFFINQLQIGEEEILNFLYYCAENTEYSDLVKNEKILKLVEFFKKETDSFKELRELD